MTNFTVNTIDNAPEGSRETLEGAEKKYGFVPNLLGVLSHAPTALKSYAGLSGLFSESSFSPVEQQVVLLTVSFENRCDYCMSAHSVIAKGSGMSDDVLGALRAGKKLDDAKLEALRTFTRTVVEKRGSLEEAEVKAFLNAGYEQSQILEVFTGVAMKTISNYTNHLAETPLDEAFSGAKWEEKEAVAA